MMKIPAVAAIRCLTAVAWCGLAAAGYSKPHSVRTPAASDATQTAADHPPAALRPDAAANLARWLLQQNGGKEALVLPLLEVMQAASGKTFLPIDRGNPTDAATIKHLGSALDSVLPSLNKADSAAHAAHKLDQMAAAFEDALAAKLGESADGTLALADRPATPAAGGTYPAFRLVERASGKCYYLGVMLHPAGAADAGTASLRFEPAEAAAVLTSDGACLLVGVEYNGKVGKDAAFLNWELLDPSKSQVRAVIGFQAEADTVRAPDALLDDGRKGRD